MTIRQPLFFASLGLLAALPVMAQNPLEALSKLQGLNSDQNIFGQVNQASKVRQQNTFRPPTSKQEDEKQQDKKASKAYKPSAIEQDYASRLGLDLNNKENNVLKQFGYDQLNDQLSTQQTELYDGGAIGGAVGRDYVLGAGDELTINFRGQQVTTEYATINNAGQVVLSNLEPIAAGGLTVAAFQQALANMAEERYGETDVFVSLSSVRQRQIMVIGEVKKPGAKQLSAFSTVMDALAAAQGIKKTGSLRQVYILRGNRQIGVDLYNILLGNGAGNDRTLQDGDRIVIPSIGRTLAITGDVARPGIFELKPGQTGVKAATALRYAGNPIRPSNNKLLVATLDGQGETINNITVNGRIQQGSILIVESETRQKRANITIDNDGLVRQRVLQSGGTVRSTLKGLEYLPENTYLPFAAIVGRQKITPINLNRILGSGKSDVPLKSGDKIVLLSTDDIRYLWSADVKNILDRKPLTRLQLIEPEPAELKDKKQPKLSEQNLFVTQKTENEPGDIEKLTTITASSCAGLSALMHVMHTEGKYRFNNAGRALTSHRLDREKTEVNRYQPCPKVFQNYGDILPLMLDNIVSVIGAVGVPGAYPVAGEASLVQMLQTAGGASRDADRNNIKLNRRYRGSGVQTEQRTQVSLDNLDVTITVAAGDSIIIRREPNQASIGTIRLEGQFEQPGIYEIRANEKLTDVIERAGGITSLAYPYGAIFSRETIQKAEEAGYERVARQLESALLSNLANLREAGQSAGLILQAVNQNIDKLRTSQAVGRMVIEADPTQLYSTPSLDILLEDNDYLYMPKRPSFVMVSGDVLNPGALQFKSSLSAEDYLDQAGGLQKGADKGRVFVILPNGEAQPLKLSFWNYKETKIPPGSTIVVPTNPVQIGFFRSLSSAGNVLSQLAISAASLAVIGRD